MAIFGKKEEQVKEKRKADVEKPTTKKKAMKKTDTAKEKKAKKPAKGAGANLTKAPGRIMLVPRVTEKAVQMTVHNTYVFEVAMDATKRDIVTAIKTLYGVTPRKVNIVRKNPRAYVARFRNRRSTKSGLKKALVFLKKGEKIDLAS